MTKQRRGEDACLGERDLKRLLGGGATFSICRRPGEEAGAWSFPSSPVPLSLCFQPLHQEVRLQRAAWKAVPSPPPNSGGVKMHWCNYSLMFWCL